MHLLGRHGEQEMLGFRKASPRMAMGTVVVPGKLKLMMVTMTSAVGSSSGCVKMYWTTITVIVTSSTCVTARNQKHFQIMQNPGINDCLYMKLFSIIMIKYICERRV